MNKNKILEKIFVGLFIIGLCIFSLLKIMSIADNLRWLLTDPDYADVYKRYSMSWYNRLIGIDIFNLILITIFTLFYLVSAILFLIGFLQKKKLEKITMLNLIFVTILVSILGYITLNTGSSAFEPLVYVLISISCTLITPIYVWLLIKEIKQRKAAQQLPDASRPN